MKPSRLTFLKAFLPSSEKSLVVANEQTDGNSRFRMLQVVREYALELFEEVLESAPSNEITPIIFSHSPRKAVTPTLDSSLRIMA